MSHTTGKPVAISLEGVGYAPPGKARLVEDMSFHVHAGEILAVVGPNKKEKKSK